MKDFYYILGTDANCSPVEIKDAYRKLSKKFHPDLNEGDKYFESRFREIKEAYDTLSDPVKRSRYDAILKKSKPGSSADTFKQPGFNSYKPPSGAYQATAAPRVWPKTTAIDIIFTLVLIAITFIFGDYVIKAMDSQKTGAAHSMVVAAAAVVPATTVKHHKKRHFLKLNTGDVSSTPKVTIVEPRQIRAVAPLKNKVGSGLHVVKVNPDTFKAQPAPAAPAVVKEAKPKDDFLYATYLKSNATGVINMRRLDDYNSEIVKTIPSNSKVFVLAKGNNYYKVRYSGDNGYVPKWTLGEK